MASGQRTTPCDGGASPVISLHQQMQLQAGMENWFKKPSFLKNLLTSKV